MKKFLIFCAFAAIVGLPRTNAQITVEEESRIVIKNNSGEYVMIIQQDDARGDGFTLSVAGIDLDFGNKRDMPKERTTDRTERRLKKKKRYKGYLGVIEFGFNGLTSPDYTGLYSQDYGDFLDLKTLKSVYLGVNFLKASGALNRSRTLGYSTALGVVWRDYVFEENITLVKSDGLLLPQPIDSKYKKSKLGTFSLTVPFVLEASFNRVFLSAGLYGDLNLISKAKYKKPKHKVKNEQYINTFGAGATVRAGFRGFYLMGNYSFTNLFKDGHGPNTRPYTIGFGTGF